MSTNEQLDVEMALNLDRRSSTDREAILADPVFGESFTDHMVTMSYRNQSWGPLRLQPFGDLSLSPATLALHYGQSIFEALKAYVLEDGAVGLFRPSANARRMNMSATRIEMPELPDGAFELACAMLSEVDSEWIPRQEGSALYVRPFMFASEPHLSVRPAEEYMFAVIASPVASYFGGNLRAISVLVEGEDVRATSGGTGAVKFAGNYAAGFAAHGRAGAAGHDQVLWLDAAEHRWVEELNAMNVMFVWRREGELVLTTPPLTGTILEGITRDTLLRLAGDLSDNGSVVGRVAERATSIDDIVTGCTDGTLVEMFACGTAAVMAPIGTLVFGGQPLTIGDGKPGPVTIALRESLMALQYGRSPDPNGWLVRSSAILEDHAVAIG